MIFKGKEVERRSREVCSERSAFEQRGAVRPVVWPEMHTIVENGAGRYNGRRPDSGQ